MGCWGCNALKGGQKREEVGLVKAGEKRTLWGGRDILYACRMDSSTRTVARVDVACSMPNGFPTSVMFN